MKHMAPLTLAALILAACTPSPAPAPAAPADTPAAQPTATETVLDCGPVAAMFDDLVKRKATGLTEADALAELSARGAYTEGYVVDAVFDLAPDGNVAIARADVLAKCRTVNKTGTTY